MAINRINLGAVKGETGATGATGAQGQAGQNGITPHIENGMWYIGTTSQNVKAKGDTWYKGNGAPTDQGVNGDLYLDALTSDVYYKDNNVWEYLTNIKGLQGQQGAQGENATSIEIGTVSTVEYGQPATATLTPLGDGAYRLDLGLPRGEQGERGEQGVDGNTTAYVGGFAVNTLSFDSNPQTQIDGKVAINQGLQNAGKILVVGSDGNVIPASSEAENDVIDAYIVGSTDYANDWLSLTPSGSPLTPLRGKIYIINTSGELYMMQYTWNGTVYERTGGGDTSDLASKSEAVGSIVMTIDSSTYVVTLQAKDVNGTNIGTAQTIDLPLESVVVNGSYNTSTKKLVLTLQNGNTIEIDISDLISGLQNEITSANKLSADLVDDTSTTNKFTNATEKATWNGKQNALDSTQMNAVNSGIDSTKVGQIATNTSAISGILDGVSIDSFGDVETALTTKQDVVDSSHKLGADLIDDTSSTNKFVTSADKNSWNAKADVPTVLTNTSASTWVADNTYTDYGYKCVLSVSGVTASDLAEVIFGVAEATSGDYAPVAETGAGSITIYSKVDDTITIPTIKVEKL